VSRRRRRDVGGKDVRTAKLQKNVSDRKAWPYLVLSCPVD
jgi:hypothetical protein